MSLRNMVLIVLPIVIASHCTADDRYRDDQPPRTSRIEPLNTNSTVPDSLLVRKQNHSIHADSDDAARMDCCCRNCRPGGWYFGAEIKVLKPHFVDEVPFYIESPVNALVDEQSGFDFDYNYDIAPSVWIGVENQGLGVRASYWIFDDTTSITTSLFPGQTAASRVVYGGFEFENNLTVGGGIPSVLQFDRRVRVQVGDGVVTASCQNQLSRWEGAAGFRYAKLEQEFVSDLSVGRLDHEHRFEGVGPTVSARGSRCIGRGLSLYCNVQGSVLYGNRVVMASLTFPLNATRFNRNSGDETMTILELGLGAELARPVARGRLFLRGGWESQSWLAAGNANNTTSNMGLQGFNLSLGLGR